MAYAAQYGSQLELRFSGSYSVPAGGDVALQFVESVPTVRINGKTTLAINCVAKTFAFSDFSIDARTTPQFEHPYREFDIASTTDCSFTHPQRDLNISSGSSVVFRFGVTADIVGSGSALDYYIRILGQSSYAISSTSALAVIPLAYWPGAFSVRSTSRLDGYDIFNAPMSFRIPSDSTLDFDTLEWRAASFSASSGSSVSFRLVGTKQVQCDIHGNSVLAGVGKSTALSVADIVCSTTVTTTALGPLVGAFAMNGISACDFVSAYSYDDVPMEPQDIVYVMARHPTTYVVN